MNPKLKPSSTAKLIRLDNITEGIKRFREKHKAILREWDRTVSVFPTLAGTPMDQLLMELRNEDDRWEREKPLG